MRYVYLDQKDWIGLAKAEVERSNYAVSELLRKLRNLVASDYVRCPLSSIHFIETARPKDRARRQRLAQLMAELSRCNVLRDARTVVERDIVMSALAQRPLKQTVGDTTRIAVGALAAFGDVRDSLVGSGGEHAVDAYRFLRALLETPAGLRWYLEQTDEEIRNNAVGNNLLHLDEFARVASDDRELIGTRSRALFVRVYCARLTIHLQVFLLLSFQRIGRDFREVLSAGPDAAVGFFRSIPYFDIEIGLREFIHFDKSRAWDRNDTNDIAALSLAVPACQVVTTDKYWSNACKKLELDAKYATQITHKLGEIDTDILE